MQIVSTNPIPNRLSPNFLWDAMLLSGFLIGAFSAIWLPDQWEPRCFFGLVLVVMSVSAWRSRGPGQRWAKSCFESNPSDRPTALFAWACLIGFTLVAITILFVICQWTGAFRGKQLIQIFDKSTGSWLWTKLPTIVGQQIMLQLLLLPVLLRLFQRTSVAVFLAALIFSLLHLPNPVLVLLTFVAGVVWVACYCQARRMTPVVISHCILAMMAAGLCGEYIFNLRVGPKCAELFPRKIDSDAGPMYEFPGCIVGIAERLVQQGNGLIVEGWAFDSVHHRSPTDLYVSIEGRLTKIEQVTFERTSASRWKNAAQAGFVSDTCFSFIATIPLARTHWQQTDTLEDRPNDVQTPREIKLFAANVNGRLAQLASVGDIQPIESVQTDQAIVLFPVEVDGRINALGRRQGAVQLTGWTADLQSHAIPKRIYVEVDGNAREIDIQAHRSQRPDIARALQDPNLSQCGFEVSIGQVTVSSASQIRCFAVDDKQQLHPIQLTEHAKDRVAKQASSNFK